MEKRPVLIFGVADRTEVILDILEKNDFLVYGILEDAKQHQNGLVGDIAVLGKTDDAQFIELLNADCLAFIAYDDATQYRQLLKELRKRYVDPPLMNVIAPEVSLPKRLTIGAGNLIEGYTALGTGVVLGSHIYIGSHGVVGHGVVMEDWVHISPRVTIGPQAYIGIGTDIGPGVIIAPGVTIGEGAQIKTNAVIEEDVPPYSVVAG